MKVSGEVNINEVIKPFIKNWRFFVTGVLMMLVLWGIYVNFTKPVFKSIAKVLVKDAKKTPSAVGDVGVIQGLPGLNGMNSNSLENELEVFNSHQTMSTIVKNLNLQIEIYEKNFFYDKELYNEQSPIEIILVNEKEDNEFSRDPIMIQIDGNKVKLSSKVLDKVFTGELNKIISLPFANIIVKKNSRYKASKTPYEQLYFVFTSQPITVEKYQKMVNISPVNKESTVLSLVFDYPNPLKARAVLAEIINQYNADAISDKNTESEKTKEFIENRINIVSKELGSVEDQKESFKTQNKIVDVQSEAAISLQSNVEAQKRLIETETQLELNNMLSNFLDNSSISNVLPTGLGMDNSNISVYNTLILERNRLLENATPENPIVMEMTKQINNLKSGIREALHKNKSTLFLTKNQLNSQLNTSSGDIAKVPIQEKLFRDIERQQQIKENLFLLLLQKREESAIALAITSDKGRVIDKGYTVRKQVAPRKFISLGIALVLGTLLPFLLILLKEFFNNKLRSKHDIEKLTHIPIIGEIPHSEVNNGVIKINDVSPIAEAFRITATRLNLIVPAIKKCKTFLVTSSVKGEGKTFISVNLALVLAKSNKKVLVIGTDVRNPQLQRYSSLSHPVGLTEYLYGQTDDVRSIIHNSGFNQNCDFIFSGVIPPNPVDLLESDRYEILLNELHSEYDYIILDSAPLMPVTDSFIISKYADATLYLVRSEVSKSQYVDFLNNSEQNISKPLIILNDVKEINFGYGNNFGYGYGQLPKKKWWKF